MMVKFFDHSEGPGDGAVDYPIDEVGRENSPPQILEGDPEEIRRLIASVDRKHTHTSGAISFAPEDAPSLEELLEVIKDFKAHFFAGLDPDQYAAMFVRHSHLDREEIHFVVVRMELTTGKALNIAPPTETHAFKESFVKAWNYEQGWADPGDPDRQRELSHPPVKEGHGYKLLATREEIHAFLTDQITLEKVTDRASMIEALEGIGLKINRQGRDYISVKTEDEKPIRLKGRIYKQDWTFSDELDRAHQTKDGSRPFRNPEDDSIRAVEARAVCLEYREKRAAFNRKTYPKPSATFDESKVVDRSNDSRVFVNPDDHFNLSIQPELIPRPSDSRAAKRADGLEEPDQRDRERERSLSDTEPVGINRFDVPAGNAVAELQSGKRPLHTDREVDDVGFDSTRARALEYAQTTAEHLSQLSAGAESSTETNRDTARENRSATSVLSNFVSNCVATCKEAISTIRDIFSLKKEQDVSSRFVSDFGSEIEP